MSNSLSQALSRLNDLVGRTDALYHSIARKMGLSDSALRILYVLYEKNGVCGLSELCSETNMARQTVHSTLRRLQQEGVLALFLRDGKNKEARLTPEGILLANKTAGRLVQMENEVLAGWNADDVAAYLALTERFLRDLQEKGEANENSTV